VTPPLLKALPFPSALVPLAAMPRWVLWRWQMKPERRDGKPRDPADRSSWTKPPLTTDGRLARTDQDQDLRPYADLFPALSSGRFSGAGFAPRAGDGLLFLDLDECRDRESGVVAGWAARIVRLCGSYCEISPSGAGLRIVGLAGDYAGSPTKTPFALAAEGAGAGAETDGRGEIYRGANYVTITFNVLPGFETDRLADIGAVAQDILSRNVLRRDATVRGEKTGPSRDPRAPIDVVRETLAVIPNRQVSWHWWKETIGMAVWAATEGSDDGLAAWDEWSRGCEAYGTGCTCEAEWDRMHASPPGRTGFGTLWFEAVTAEAGAGRRWAGGPRWKEWKAQLGGLGSLGGLPGSVGAASVSEGEGAGAEPMQVGSDGARIRPTIQVVAGKLSETADAAEQALVAGGWPVYTRDRLLVMPSVKEIKVRGGGTATVAGLHRLGLAALTDVLAKAATWVKWDGRSQRLVACDPPGAVASVLLERPGPRPFPEVSGISATPGLRADGSISADIGYDPHLNVHRVLDRSLRMPEGWSDRPPVRADAEKALGLLDGLLDGFPFVDACDRAVALAMILTCVCRCAMPVAPVFAVTATMPGTGKSHLVDLASAIATGQRCPAAGAGRKDEETEKRLGGLIAAGYPLVSIDNLNGTLRSDTLSQAVERDRLRIRLLGSSDMLEVECRTTFTVNGNGLTLSGDLVRRTMQCRMDAGVESPENRAFTFDPVRLVEAGRGPYVAAVLTVLRAHAEAGFPGAIGLKPIASYEDWSRFVRGALVWLGVADPEVSMDRSRVEDPDICALRDMLTAWQRGLGGDKGRGWTAREAIDAVMSGGMMTAVAGGGGAEAAGVRGDLMEAMSKVAGERGGIDSRRLGIWLGANAGRIVDGMRFMKHATSANYLARWSVERMRPVLRIVE